MKRYYPLFYYSEHYPIEPRCDNRIFERFISAAYMWVENVTSVVTVGKKKKAYTKDEKVAR